MTAFFVGSGVIEFQSGSVFALQIVRLEETIEHLTYRVAAGAVCIQAASHRTEQLCVSPSALAIHVDVAFVSLPAHNYSFAIC